MKKIRFFILLTVMIFIFMPEVAFGDFGLKAGLNFSNLKFSSEMDQDWGNLTAFRLGAFARIPVYSRFFFQPEMYFAKKGSMTTGQFLNSDISAKIELTYVEIPLLLVFSIPVAKKLGVSIFAGPYAAVRIGAKQVTEFLDETQEEDIKDEISDVDCGYQVGTEMGFGLGKGKLLMDLRFCGGFGNIHRKELVENTIRNQGLSVMLGYQF